MKKLKFGKDTNVSVRSMERGSNYVQSFTESEKQHVINLFKLLVKENINIKNISYKKNKLNNIVATYLKENTIKDSKNVLKGLLSILEKKE